jgi:endo-1,4-beta-xylanase
VEALGEIDTGAGGGGGGGTAGVTLDLTTVSEWDSGFCMDAVVSNLSGSAVAWEVRATIHGTISGIWNAEYLLDGSDYVFVGVDWNSELGPGETAEFGFCGDR